eukprot:747992-Rhodomonas_salina.1
MTTLCHVHHQSVDPPAGLPRQRHLVVVVGRGDVVDVQHLRDPAHAVPRELQQRQHHCNICPCP